MAIALDFLGYVYDTSVPAFVVIDDKHVVHRASRRLVDLAHLQEAMIAQGYTPGGGEIGINNAWATSHYGIRAYQPSPPPPSAPPIPFWVVVTGEGTTVLKITMNGNPEAGGLYIANLSVDGFVIDTVGPVIVSASTTLAELANAVATALDGLMDPQANVVVTAAAQGGVVTVTSSGTFDSGVSVTLV